jgi:hypothetical protein
MPANDPPQPSSPDQDPNRTVAYRPSQGQPQHEQQYGQQYGQQQYGQQQHGQPGQPTRQYGQPAQQYGQPYSQGGAGYPAQPGHEPSAAYSPQPAWAQGSEMLGSAPPKPSSPKRARGWVLAIVAAVVVALIGGGGYFAVNLLSGGGTQPQDVLPANALGYIRLDLDPAANQKLALFGIARKFTVTKDTFTGDDPRQAFFGMIKKQSSDLSKIDYARDIEPWLGQRVGIALLEPKKGSTQPQVVAAVQVTDQAKAREGIAKLDRASGGSKTGVAFRDDYAIISDTQALADRSATGPVLSTNTDFTGDLATLGEPGVLSFWMDMARVAKIAGTITPQDQATLGQFAKGRFVGALRFESDYVELAGVVRGADALKAQPEAAKLTDLPASTVGAVSISGLGEVLSKQWSQIMKMISASADGQSIQQQITATEQSTGLKLPEDIVTLLGKNLTFAVDDKGLDGNLPNIGARLTTDPAKAQAIVDKLEKAIADTGGTAPQIAKVSGDGTFVLASSQQYAAELAKGGGTLGDSETFQKAIPNAGDATFAAYVDLDKLEKLYLKDLEGDARANAKALRAVGLSGSRSGDQASFSLRVLFN